LLAVGYQLFKEKEKRNQTVKQHKIKYTYISALKKEKEFHPSCVL